MSDDKKFVDYLFPFIPDAPWYLNVLLALAFISVIFHPVRPKSVFQEDFETCSRIESNNGRWSMYGGSYSWDDDTPDGSENSLKLVSTSFNEATIAVHAINIDGSKKLSVQARMKGDALSSNTDNWKGAGVWLQWQLENREVGWGNILEEPIFGSFDWREVSAEIEVPENVDLGENRSRDSKRFHRNSMV